MAHQLVIDRWRGRGARPREVVDIPRLYLGVPDQTERLLSRMLVREAVAGLTPKYRATLVEVFVRDRSLKEAAAALGVPVGTVKSRRRGYWLTPGVGQETHLWMTARSWPVPSMNYCAHPLR